MEIICLILYLCLRLNTVQSQLSDLYAKEIVPFRNTRSFSKLLKIITVDNLFYCTRSCLEHLDCMSFFYKATSGGCQLHHVTFVESAALSNDQGWKYYQVYTDNCPPYDGFIQNRLFSLCYKIYPEVIVNIPAFKATCQSENSELLKVESEDKWNHVIDFLDNIDVDWLIIQGSDAQSEGNWRYDDGTPLTYTDWDTPNSQPAGETPGDDYIASIKNPCCEYRWHDVIETYAELTTRYICQKKD